LWLARSSRRLALMPEFWADTLTTAIAFDYPFDKQLGPNEGTLAAVHAFWTDPSRADLAGLCEEAPDSWEGIGQSISRLHARGNEAGHPGAWAEVAAAAEG